jgi:hypothetical protein
VPAVRPERLLLKAPVPVPLVVFELATVGLGEVDQQIPFAVTVAPPSFVTFPPETALVSVTEEIGSVVRVGNAVVVNERSVP